MFALKYYGSNPNCDSNILSKLLDMDCKPKQVDSSGYTALMNALEYYGQNPNCNHNILLKLLNMNCVPEQVNIYPGETALMYSLKYYGSNLNCDSSVLHKLFNMNCAQKQVYMNSYTFFTYAFQYYGTNPNYDPHIFVKLILLLHPIITRSGLIELLDRNTRNLNLKNNIMKAYLYNRRRAIINSRISKRVIKGKCDSLSIFD